MQFKNIKSQNGYFGGYSLTDANRILAMARKPRLSWTMGLTYLVFNDISSQTLLVELVRRAPPRTHLQGSLQHHADPSPRKHAQTTLPRRSTSILPVIGHQGDVIIVYLDWIAFNSCTTSFREYSPGPSPPPYPTMGDHECLAHGRRRHRKRWQRVLLQGRQILTTSVQLLRGRGYIHNFLHHAGDLINIRAVLPCKV